MNSWLSSQCSLELEDGPSLSTRTSSSEWNPWLHVSQGFLWDKFQYLGAFANSAVFLCTDRISHADVLEYSWDAISYEEASRLLQVCLNGTQDQDRGRRYLLELSQCMLAGYKGSPEDGAKKIQGITVPDRRQTRIGYELNSPDGVLGFLRSMPPVGFNPERYLELNRTSLQRALILLGTGRNTGIGRDADGNKNYSDGITTNFPIELKIAHPSRSGVRVYTNQNIGRNL